MSVTDPVYSANPVLDALEHVGHEAHVIFDDGSTIAQKLPLYIKVAEDVAADSPTVVADTTAVVASLTGGAALFDSLVAAVSGFGANPAADVAVLTSLVADAPKVGSYWSNVKAAVTILLTTLGGDEKQIASVFAPVTPTA